MKLTKCSTTELTPTVEHSAEAPTFTAVDGKSMRNTRESERTPLAENAASEQARPRQTSRERPVSQPIGPAGIETARKAIDQTLPSNELMTRWAASAGKPI